MKRKSSTEVMHAGDTIVSDVRTMRTYSNKGSRYVVTFVDRKSRLVRVAFVKRKSDVAQEVKNFIKWVGNQRRQYPRKFQSDNGTEYINKDLQNFCKELGIEYETSQPYSPEQNGIAERINRTLVEGTFASLRHAGLPDGFWEEAMNQFVYVKNRTPHSKLNGKRPIDEWNELMDVVEREDIWSLKQFGCRADVHIPVTKRTGGKDGPKVKICIYLGKDPSSKGELFYDYKNDKIIKGGHANYFYENIFPLNPDSNTDQKSISTKSILKKVRFEQEERKTDTKKSIDSKHINQTDKKKKTNKNKQKIYYDDSDSSSSESDDIDNEHKNSDVRLNNEPDQDYEDIYIDVNNDEQYDDNESKNYNESDSSDTEDTSSSSEDETPLRRSGRHTNTPNYTEPNLKTKLRNVNGVGKNVGYTGKLRNMISKIFTTTQKEKEKITRAKMLKRKDKNEFILDEINEIQQGFETGCLERVNKNDIPEGADIYSMMWVYKIKPETELEKKRYRSRLCVLGNRQKPDSYSETFAAVAKTKTFRTLLSLCVHYGLKMTQLDISNAFMYADLDRDVYVYPPPGYQHLGILKLKKSLYGLKQAPRLWYDTMKAALLEMGFVQLQSDVCCFTHPTSRCYVLMYVDDICVATKDEKLRQEILEMLQAKFRLKHFKLAKRYVGLQLKWSKDGDKVKVYQKDYIEKILKSFNMSDCKDREVPAEASVHLSKSDELTKDRPFRAVIGSLLYTLGSRPDVASAVRRCSQYAMYPSDKLWNALKVVMRYLSGTKGLGVVYEKEDEYYVTAYSDSDYSSEEDRKSISGYVVYAQNGPIVWKSKKQPTVALSSCEAEYVALASTIQELLWVSMALTELGVKQSKPMKIYIDNQAAQRLAENPVNQDRTKHIDVRYHFIRQVIASGKVVLEYVDTKKNVSDLLTKSTSRKVFTTLVTELVRS